MLASIFSLYIAIVLARITFNVLAFLVIVSVKVALFLIVATIRLLVASFKMTLAIIFTLGIFAIIKSLLGI